MELGTAELGAGVAVEVGGALFTGWGVVMISVSEGADASVEDEVLLELELSDGADREDDPDTTVLLSEVPEPDVDGIADEASGVETLLVWFVLGNGSATVTGCCCCCSGTGLMFGIKPGYPS